MSRYVIIVFILALTVSKAWSVQPYQPVHPDPVLEPWRWRSFPELKGLGLWCMAEDRDGNMWFGTEDGVLRYDGVNWTAYTSEDGLPDARVRTLCAGRDGSLYAGSNLGISRFSGGGWDRVFPQEGDLPWHVADLMQASDGDLWAGTAWGALRLGREGETLFTTVALGAALRVLVPGLSLFIVPDEVAPVRILSEKAGVRTLMRWYWNAVSVPGVVYALAPESAGARAGLKVGDRILTADGSSGNPDLDTSVRLSVQREGQAFEVTVKRERTQGEVRDFWIFDVFEGREGAMWFGLSAGEILRYDPDARKGNAAVWRLYTDADGLAPGYIPRIAQTQDGILWAVSEDGTKGVNRFDPGVGEGRAEWTHFRPAGPRHQDRSILETGDGTLWIGGRGQLHAYRNGVWTTYEPPEVPLPTVRTCALVEASDGALWVAGLGDEAVRLDYGTARWTTYRDLLFQCETPDGSLWFVAKDSSAVRYDGRRWTRYGVEDGLMQVPLRLIATREGVLWASGGHESTAATARFDGHRWSLETHPRLCRIIRSGVYEGLDGTVWFGAGEGGIRPEQVGGVVRFDPSEGARENGTTWTHYTPPEAPRQVNSMGQTPDGSLWFGGWVINGLRFFDGQHWTHTTEPEAFTQTNTEAIYASVEGDLWAGTRNYGVFRFNGEMWTQYDVRDGLADNYINASG